MRAHFLQHVPYEGLGSIEAWLRAKKAEVSNTRFYLDEALPDLSGIDLLIIMGGPMSVNDEDTSPWLKEEKTFIRNAIEMDVSILGVCLGSQLIASSMGSRVYPNIEKEIGWFPITPDPDASLEKNFKFQKEVIVFHWHGETFDIPKGAKRLAYSSACRNQAFQLGRKVLGFQFHLEATPESVSMMLNSCKQELVLAPYIQTENDITSVSDSFYKDGNLLMSKALDYLTEENLL